MVAVKNVTKTFPGTLALDRVTLAISVGTVHALVGANGSGKSTLVRVLTGVHHPDAGSIVIGGRELTHVGSPNEANALGIAAVHQESPLVDTLTVTECVALFRGYPSTGGRIRWRSLRRQTGALLERYQVNVDQRTLAGELSPADRALVGLAIALDRVDAGLQLLVLDEVTASLPQDQADTYLQRVEALARGGTPVLMVTHRLAEVRRLARDVTVLRDGRVVHEGTASGVSDSRLIEHVTGVGRAPVEEPVGTEEPVAQDESGAVATKERSGHVPGKHSGNRSALALWRGPRRTGSPVVMAVDHLAGELVRDASFAARAGEILGIGGRPESGINELPLLLSGAVPRNSGTIRIDQRELSRRATPRDFLDAGLALLPADRLHSGGVASLSIRENVVLPAVRKYWHRRARERSILRELITSLDVRPPTDSALFGSLSGGNQQKVLLGKWLLMGPSVLVLDDPTSGVDPGARETIFALLRQAAGEGLSVLLFSTEPEQLAAMSSRFLVLRDGVIETELADNELNLQNVTTWCYL